MIEHIKSIFEKFEEEILELTFYSDIVQESYERYLSKIEEQINNEFNIDFHSSKRAVYFDIKNKHEKIISDLHVKKTLDQTRDNVHVHFNKQMQCFLVEAYEVYEDFLEKMYATMGYLDNNFWKTSDLGQLQLIDIENKSENYFFEQVKEIKNKPYSILEVFEKRLNLAKYSNKNIPFENYQFLMLLISEFRNAIVHDRGFLDKKILKEKLIKKLGINGDKLKKEYEKFIDFYYYEEDKYKNNICLTAIRSVYCVDNTPVLPIKYDRRLILTQDILSYGYLLSNLAIEHFSV